MYQESEYVDMVKNLFKKDESNVVMAMHAAIGISGEVGEIFAADSRQNMVEELGDLMFYMEALRQRLRTERSDNLYQTTEVADSPYNHPNESTVRSNLVIVSAEILDLCKKSWVYGKEFQDYKVSQFLLLLERNYLYFLSSRGFLADEIAYVNMQKLLKGKNARYASGTYSDAQAQARADKVVTKFEPREVSLTKEGVATGGSATVEVNVPKTKSGLDIDAIAKQAAADLKSKGYPETGAKPE